MVTVRLQTYSIQKHKHELSGQCLTSVQFHCPYLTCGWLKDFGFTTSVEFCILRNCIEKQRSIFFELVNKLKVKS